MKPKKNPPIDLNSERGLYFVIGLVLLLALLYAALEWKTPFDDGGYDMDESIENEQQSDSSVIIRTKTTKIDTVLD